MNAVRTGDFIQTDDGVVHVRASRVTNTQQFFNCPFCRTRYRFNKMPYRNAKHQEHNHSFDPTDATGPTVGPGVVGNPSSGAGHFCSKRFPHCGPKYNGIGQEIATFPRKDFNVFCIHITNRTKKQFKK